VLEELEAHADDSAAADAPSLIYAKPAAVVRHLESIIGVGAVEAGLRSWLRRHAGGSSKGDELVGKWSAAAGVDLSAWRRDWLATRGVNTLGFDPSASVVHQAGLSLRTHHLTIQVFDDGLAPREPIDVVVSGTTTPVPAKAVRDAALVVLNARHGRTPKCGSTHVPEPLSLTAWEPSTTGRLSTSRSIRSSAISLRSCDSSARSSTVSPSFSPRSTRSLFTQFPRVPS
jgi:hypothetical protein